MSVSSNIPTRKGELKLGFRRAGRGDGIYLFFEPQSLPVSRQILERLTADCKKNKIDCIIPCLSGIGSASGSVFALISEFYGELLALAEKRGVHVALAMDKLIEDCFFCSSSPVPEETRKKLSAKILNHREYYCSEGEHVEMELGKYTLMSVSAFDEENAQTIEISEHIKDGVLSYDPPVGNWVVNAYTCDGENILGDGMRASVNKMSYASSSEFLAIVLDILGESVARHLGKTLSVIYMNDICFDAPNRRNWDGNFNNKFREMYNFSPEPYYNALFYSIGEKTPHIKTLFMTCRARMLREGILSALSDFAREHGLELISGITEPKLADCSWLTGDALGNFEHSSCALLDKAYMYGINSLSLASSAGQNFGLEDVFCELYGNYYTISSKIMFKDAINAYSRGCTRLLVHNPEYVADDTKDRFSRKRLLALNSRCRHLLRGGSHVSDIAILYPSYSMHSEIYLYQTSEDGFEYPNILPYNDHMTVVNMLSYYCGQDTVLVHPHVMRDACTVSGKRLKMKTRSGTNSFGVIILPGMSVIDIQSLRLIKEFYDNGGKIIATGRLPHYAAEYHPEHEKEVDENDFMHLDEYATSLDTEVRETISHIFGSETSIQSKLKEYYHNKNSNGGEAYFLCASKTTSDGTLFCDEQLLKRILQSFKIPLDVYMSSLPEQMVYDALNDIYPNFSRLGLNVTFPGGGMVNHIHKKRRDLDIYFFSNTTDTKYSGYVFIKGMLCPTALNPATGKRQNISYRYVNYNGEVYTAVRLHLDSCQCVFILSPEGCSPKRKVQSIPKIDSIELNFLTE